jgi:flagellar motor switch/type III secretory pathway protein FliN
MAEAEEDFNRRIAKMQEDRRSNLVDLLESRDVRGLVKTMRDSRKSISEAQEQYNISRQKDEDNFRRQQARRAEEYEIQRQQREEDYRLQNERAAEQYARESAQQKIAFDEQKQAIIDALAEQTEARSAAATKEEEEAEKEKTAQLEKLKIDFGLEVGEWEKLKGYLTDELYPTMMVDLDTFLDEAKGAWLAYARDVKDMWDITMGMTGSSGEPDFAYFGQPGARWNSMPPPRQAGGYATSGIYQLGERGREFVLSADTTRQLERRYGMLTQGALMGNAGVNITFAPSYSGMGREDREWYRATAREEASQLLAQVTKQKRGAR